MWLSGRRLLIIFAAIVCFGGLFLVLSSYRTTTSRPKVVLPSPAELAEMHSIWDSSRHREVGFWDGWFKYKGYPDKYDQGSYQTTEAQYYRDNFDPTRPFDYPWLLNHNTFDSTTKEIRILDVGAGPLTALGKHYADAPDGYKLRITPTDPLAEDYKKLYAKFDVKPITDLPINVPGEELSSYFGQEVFDFVHSRNALDHSFNAPKVVREMLLVTKKGGWVVIKHHPKEGANAKYQNLHRWDFFQDESVNTREYFFRYGADGTPIPMSLFLGDLGEMKVLIHEFTKSDFDFKHQIEEYDIVGFQRI